TVSGGPKPLPPPASPPRTPGSSSSANRGSDRCDRTNPSASRRRLRAQFARVAEHRLAVVVLVFGSAGPARHWPGPRRAWACAPPAGHAAGRHAQHKCHEPTRTHLHSAHDANAVGALDPNHTTAPQDMTKVQLHTPSAVRNTASFV